MIRAHNWYSNRDAHRIDETGDRREYMTRGLRNCWCSGWLGFTLNLVRLTSFRLLNTISAGNELNHPTYTISSQLRLSTINQLRLSTINRPYSSSMNRLYHSITSSPCNSTTNRLHRSTMYRLRRSMRHSELAQGIFQNCRRTGTVYSGSVGNPVPYNEELSLHQDKSEFSRSAGVR